MINRIDIDIDSSLEKHNDQKLLIEIFISSETIRLSLKISKSPYQNLILWPESTKVVDYLKQIRIKTIEELKNGQEAHAQSNTISSIQIVLKVNKSKRKT